ncbi:MAG: hypothetical protein WC683_02635 [bacterium]
MRKIGTQDEFYRPINYAEVASNRDAQREKAIRLYSTQHGAAWNLQIRSPLTKSNGQDGAVFMIATASLNRAEMMALAEAIDGFLTDE